MATYSSYKIDEKIRNPKLQEVIDAVMDVTSGHDHDGTNSKAVTTGTPANGSVTNAMLATDVKVGSLATLTTTEVATVVGAINELDAENGDLATLTTTATDLVGAINEVDADVATALVNAAAAASEAGTAYTAAVAAAAAVAASASLTGAETLTNKTLTAPKIATTDGIFDGGGDEYVIFTEGTTPKTYIGITSGNTGVAPKVQGAGETNTDLHLLGTGTGNVKVSDGTDPTKFAVFELNGATTGTATTFAISQTQARTVTFPDATDTLVGKATTDVMTNKTLTSPVLTTPQINDTSADHQYVFAVSELAADRTVTLPLLTGADEFVFKDFAQTLTNKTLTSPALTSPVITTPQINDTSADHQYVFAVSELAADRTVTLPLLTGADEFVFKDHTQTLTNKTLTSPAITGAVVTGATISSLVLDDGDEDLDIAVADQTDSGATATIPDLGDSADTFVMEDVAQTLTNKTIDAASNPLKNVVLAYAASITRAEMITGKALVAAAVGRTIRVLSVKLTVSGAFNGGAGTAFILEDSSSTVDILTCLKAALTDGAKISTEGLAIANVTEGAGMSANLTAANGISVQADAAWDAGTSIYMVIQYMYV